MGGMSITRTTVPSVPCSRVGVPCACFPCLAMCAKGPGAGSGPQSVHKRFGAGGMLEG